jgi:carbon-monoxide dehydrogenase medium subunit
VKDFELCEPQSLQEAFELLDPSDPAVRPMAGGTALLLMMKAGVFQPSRIVSLRSLGKRFSEIALTGGGEVRLGAMATLSELERSPLVQRELPVVAQTLRTLSNVRVRNVATLGGHLAHADPHMDLPPLLIALGASLSVVGPSGGKTIVADELFSGYYETVLAPDELITDVRLRVQGQRRAAYLKCTTRSVDDWPALGVAVVLEVGNDSVTEAHVLVSAATEKPTRLTGVEDVLRGANVDGVPLDRAAEAARDEVRVVGDARGSAAYKRELVGVYVARAIRQSLSRKQ